MNNEKQGTGNRHNLWRFFSAGKGGNYVRNQIFIKGTRTVFYQMLAKCGKHDSYYSSFFYCVGISEDTRNHVDRMFDFKERLIKPEALHEGWQTGGSARLTRLAFNLWNGYVEKGEESLSTPYEMFDCGYAPYFYEAIRIKYPEYCRDLPQVSKKETNHER